MITAVPRSVECRLTVHRQQLSRVFRVFTVAFSYDGIDEHKRMSEHRQRDCHQLRGMQHHSATDEDTDTEPSGSTDDNRTTHRDQNTV